MAFSFIRFSSAEQKKGDSTRRQEKARDEWLKDNPHVILDTKYKLKHIGSAFRGAHRDDNQALGQFLKLVEASSIKPGSYLIIENLDRLSREDEGTATELFLSLVNRGIVVVQLLPERIEFRKPVDMIKLIRAVVELSRGHSESAMKSVRLAAAWANKRNNAREKKTAISAKCPAWLCRNGDRYEVIPENVEAVRLMFTLSAEGFGINGIIRRLVADNHKPFGRTRNWNNTYIGNILAGRAVLGEYQPFKNKKPEGEPIKGFYPAVVSEELWWKVQAGLKQRLNHKGGRHRGEVNLFSSLMIHALDDDKIEYRNFKDARKIRGGKVYLHPRYVNSLALVAQAKLSSFPAPVLERGVLECLREIDPMDILPNHDTAEDDLMVLRAEFESCETQLKDIEDRLVKGESATFLVNAGTRLEARKEELGKKIADARMKASNPQSESWGTCHTLISALATCEDREAARLRLQTALRNVVKKMVCLFVKGGRRQIAVVQFHFDGSEEVRTVFIMYRGELTNIKEKTPEYVSWSTSLKGISQTANIEDAKTRAIVLTVLEELCKEDNWVKTFEPDRVTGAEKIRHRKVKYMKTYLKTYRRKTKS